MKSNNKQQKRKKTRDYWKPRSVYASFCKEGCKSYFWGESKNYRCSIKYLCIAENVRMPHLEPHIQLQVPAARLKLQLFPMNELIQLRLEKGGYNPYLEITLSGRKKISSVVRHLNGKWGSTNVADGQLMLFPYNRKLDQVASCRRWTLNDTVITAWEVYVDVGSPPVFRLRYGWHSNLLQEACDTPPESNFLDAHNSSGVRRTGCSKVLEIPNHQEGKTNESCEPIEKHVIPNETWCSDVNELSTTDRLSFLDDEMKTHVLQASSHVPWDDSFTNLSIGGLQSEISMQHKINQLDSCTVSQPVVQPTGLVSDIGTVGLPSETSLTGKMSNSVLKPENEFSLQPIFFVPSDISIGGLLSEASLLSNKNKLDQQTKDAGHALSQSQSLWYDNYASVSIGGLLSEASLEARAVCKPELLESKTTFQTNALLSDFFHYSALATQLKPSFHETNLSILDAEETCHAFPAQKFQQRSNTKS